MKTQEELEKCAQRINFAWTGEKFQWKEVMRMKSKGYLSAYTRWMDMARAALSDDTKG